MNLAVSRALRVAMPEVLACLLGFTRDLPAAEDALHDAVVKALEQWPKAGLPNKPAAWLMTVARNRHRDRIRGSERAVRLAPVVAAPPWTLNLFRGPDTPEWRDDLLRLIFTCCDPVLGLAERAALTLHTVVGLTRDELARAFLVAPRTMEQRLTRARRRLAQRAADYTVPDPSVAPERVGAVLEVLHLVFNEGYWSAGDEGPVRADLCALAGSLTRSLNELLPEVPEIMGLHALIVLHDARLAARLDGSGKAIPLPQQDRHAWNRPQIQTGCALIRLALSHGRPGPFQLEAAIAAVHCEAPTAAETDWAQIARLYELLEAFRPSAVVRVNRAFAVGQAAGPAAGLALLSPAMADPAVATRPYGLLVRARLHHEAGDLDLARADYLSAVCVAQNDDERRVIAASLVELQPAEN